MSLVIACDLVSLVISFFFCMPLFFLETYWRWFERNVYEDKTPEECIKFEGMQMGPHTSYKLYWCMNLEVWQGPIKLHMSTMVFMTNEQHAHVGWSLTCIRLHVLGNNACLRKEMTSQRQSRYLHHQNCVVMLLAFLVHFGVEMFHTNKLYAVKTVLEEDQCRGDTSGDTSEDQKYNVFARLV